MKFRPSFSTRRASYSLAAVALLGWPLLSALTSYAEDRKFLVILANMPRSFPAEPSPTGVPMPPGWVPGAPPIPMPNLADIEQVYYSDDPEDGLGSFAEYWSEISCGIVSIAGKAMGTVELPWPQYPVQGNETTTDTMAESGSIEEDWSPSTQSNGVGYFDLNNAGDFQFGAGEQMREDVVLYETDFNNTADGEDIDPQNTIPDNDSTVSGPGTEDTDADGKVDLGVEDLDDDQLADFGNEDVNMNCILDSAVSEDCFCGDCNGVWEAALGEDCNGNGLEDFNSEDLDGDGRLDAGEVCLPCLPGSPACLKCTLLCIPCSPGDADCHLDANCDGELSDTEDLDGDGNFDIATEDTNGNCACGNYPCPPDETPGFDPFFYIPTFTPGERFRDIDGDLYYDAFFEPATIDDRDEDDVRNKYSDTNNRLTDPQDYVDSNVMGGDDKRDLPEPLEDFLVMKISNEPGQPQYGRVSTQYIRDNYPGNVAMLVRRVGNNNIAKEETGRLVYDSADYWIDIQTADNEAFTDYRKLEQDSLEPVVLGHTVPRPSWLEDFWKARYGNDSASELAALPNMGWQFDTPNLVEFEPLEESTFESDEYAFQADRGGTGGWGTVLEQMLHMFPTNGALGLFLIEGLQPGGPNGTGGIVFDYNGTLHRYAYLENPGFPPVPTDENSLSVLVEDDFIFNVSQSGRSGCIMPDGAAPDPGGDPVGTWGCDFDMDGDDDEIGHFGPLPSWIPTSLPGSPGGMQAFEDDGVPNDFMFDPCEVPSMKHPECNFDDFTPPQPEYPFPFSETALFPPTNRDCACVALDVGDPANGFPEPNAQCDSGMNNCWIDPATGFCRVLANDPPIPPDYMPTPVECFVPRCTPVEGGSPYYPIPKFTAPAGPTCDVPFAIRWGDGRMIEIDDEFQWPGFQEGDDGDEILPPSDLVHDGPKEYDDLASSFYHTRWIPGNPSNGEPVAVLLNYGGDQSFGEVITSSPDVADRMSYGHDKASLGSTGTTFVPDGTITPAGPLAGGDTAYFAPGGKTCMGGPNQGQSCEDDSDCPPDALCDFVQVLGFDGILDLVHGGPGYDGGNQMILEYMTWRREGVALSEPLTGPGTMDGRGFRDFNLDGMLDLGEGRQFPHERKSEDTLFGGTENYVIDSFIFTAPNDGMDILAYPFNRDRLIEDVIEALDPVEDFDTWVNGAIGCLGSSTADISHITYLPEGLPSTRPFAVTSPSLTMPIITVDRMPPAANQRVRLQDMLSPPPYTFPNLAASLDRSGETNQALETNASFNVAFAAHEFGHYWECWPDLYDYDVFDGFQNEHPIGSWDLMSGSAAGLVHVIPVFKENSGWIQSNDLSEILIPGVPQTLRLGPIESSCDQYYFFENALRSEISGRQERFYFFHLEDHGEFSIHLPWDRLPAESSLSDGSFKSGGMMVLHTDLAANSEGVPPQQRLSGHFTYLYEQADGQHSLEVTINAGGNTGDSGDPYPGFLDITELNVGTDPDNRWWDTAPGDSSGIDIIDVRNELSGSQATFLWFPQDIPTLQFVQPPGGRSISGNFPLIYRWDDQHAGTGLTIFSQPVGEITVDELGICTDGCYGGTKVNTAPISKTSPSTSTETLQVPVGEGTAREDGQYRFYAFLDPRHRCPANDGQCENRWSPPVAAATNEGEGMLTVNNVVLDVNNSLSTRLEAWIVTHVGLAECEGNGQWQVQGTVSGVQRTDPDDPDSSLACASTNGQYTTRNPNGSITFTITGMNFVVGDRFIFVTSGFTTYSGAIEVKDGEVDPGPVAIVTASSAQEECCTPPVTVTFDGSASTDSAGNSGTGSDLVLYEWDLLDDGTIDSTGPLASFTFTETGEFVVRLTVSEGAPNFRTGTVLASIEVRNNRPIADFTATPSTGPSNLLVHFDASASFDPDGEIVKYEWDFGYEGSHEGCDLPMVPETEESGPEIDRIFGEGSFTVALRVTDDDGDLSCVTLLDIHSGNQPPTASFTASPEGGAVPLAVVFDASASSDPDGDQLMHSWYFEDDGSTVETGTNPVVEHEFTEVKASGWLVTLTVDDLSEGGAGTGSASTLVITTLGTGGLVSITQATATPESGASPLTVSLSAIATSENPGELTYRWELDDLGAIKFGRNVSHRYENHSEDTKTFNPKLIVFDASNGAQDVRVLEVKVLPPGATGPTDDPNIESVLTVVGGTTAGEAPFVVQFSTEGSKSLDGTRVTVVVDFGDATPTARVLAGSVINHTYTTPGTYQATALTITEDGRQELSEIVTIIVTESGSPIASIFVDRINGVAPLRVTLDGSGSFDPEGQALTYEWDFDDGTPSGFGSVVQHTFNGASRFMVTLTVRDASGASGTAQLEIAVDAPGPNTGGGGLGAGDPGDQTGPDADGDATGACGLGCGPMGAVQMLAMLLGIVGMKLGRRRRR